MKDPETPAERVRREQLEARCALILRKVTDRIKRELPPHTGMALFVFDLGGGGNIAYASTAEREGMIKGIREWLEKVED